MRTCLKFSHAVFRSGRPPHLVHAQMQRLCRGYELKAALEFATNGDGEIDVKDGDYWNGGEGWLPIGSSSNAFKAVFEGNGHVIRNLYIRRPNAYGVGLFGYTNNATIRRVGLTGTLTQITGQSYVGGVLGRGTATHLQGVFASGALSSAYTSNAYMGGVAGYLEENSTIEDSFSTVSVTAKSSYAGGLVGYLSNSAVNRTFSTGRVYSDLGSNIGGLIGYASSNIITQSYWATDSSGQSRSNGTSNSNPSYFGITLAELGCASASNNTSCVSGKTLFENWPTGAAANDGIAWVFDGNGLPALSLNGKQYRDRDGDGYLDQDDKWPGNYAAAIDADNDGHPDRWTLGCDDECVANSGLTLDMFPETAAAWQDDDMDGFPDSWADDCDEDCQNASDLTLDPDPLDPYNGTPPDGIVIIDADHNGLIDIHTLDDLNAIRYNLEGTGLKLSANDENNSEGCPPRLVNGQMQRLCRGYELKADLDFDTNSDGKIDEKDTYWNDEAGWLPIGNNSSGNAFRAIFEGNGHVIRNLYINRPNASYIGLFGYANNATIRRVGLTGTLTQITGYSNVGGILGYGTATHLQGVFASGALSSANTSTASMGGVAGELTSNSTLEDSFSIASVTAKNDLVGGLVGYLSNSAINRTFSTGRVFSDSTSFVGGLIGYAYSSVVDRSYWASDSSGQSSSAGTSSSNSSYFGATLAELGCADAPNNTSCVSNKTLFENWPTDAAASGGIVWVFSADQKLPALKLGNNEYRDSDGDGYLDQDDQFPDNYAAAIDADGDGHPDRWTLGCDDECVTNSGLTLDMFPETAAAWQDDDLDGLPDYWAVGCDVGCQQNSGLTLDAYPNDFDNDGVPDLLDPDNNADNGAPEMQAVPSKRHMSVDTTGVVGLLKYSDLLTELKAFDAVDGYDLTYQATANDALLEVQTIEDEQYLLVPVGRQVVQWTAKDNSGNQSEPMEQIVNVYPQIGFVKSESITGENSSAGIEMYLSGVSPVYPLDIELEFDKENSTLSQADIAAINLSEIQTVQFLAGSTSAKLTINVLSDDKSEEDETLLVRLVRAKTGSKENKYFTFSPSLREHVLTVTEKNLPPVVLLSVYQAGKEVSEVNWEQGDVTIEASIHDPNGNDSHTIAWDLSDLPHALVDEAKVSFSPDRLAGGDYSIAITVTDDGQPPLFAEAQLDIRINRPVVDEKPASTPSKKKKRGSFPWPVLTVLVAAYAMRKLRHKGHAA